MTASLYPLPHLLLTIGDINGISPEVMARAIADSDVLDHCRISIVGNSRLLGEYFAALDEVNTAHESLIVRGYTVPVIEIPSEGVLQLGTVDAGAGKLAGDAIAEATRRVLQGKADAIVTMPISKEALNAGGYLFPGHTEMIAAITGGIPLMILMTEGMRVALATIHIPLRAVSDSITQQLIEERVAQFSTTLRNDFGVAYPRIAVLALNPHAGEDGLIGNEEKETIIPALAAAESVEQVLYGPLPADGFFAHFDPAAQDGILAMYHDQGLIPLKLYAGGAGVNVTANLPIVRTSPDHGTAFGIAGRGIADARSTVEAIRVAISIAQSRRSLAERAAL